MESRQPNFWAASLVTYIAAITAFVLRLFVRKRIGLQLSIDDYFSLAAFVFTTGFTVVNLYKLKFGLGLHLHDIGVTHEQATSDYFRLLWVDSWFYTTSIGASKLTVLAFYWRIFGHSSIKRPIQVLVICVIFWMLVRVFIIPIQCFPIQRYWDRTVEGVCPIKTNIFFFATTIPHLFMEIAIVVLPIFKVQQLVISRAQKVAVGGLFASGTIVCVASLVQLIQAFHLNTKSPEIWWTGTPQLMCSVIEVNLGHFSTSLPNLRPVLDIVTSRNSSTTSRNLSLPFQQGVDLQLDQVLSISKSDAYCKV